MTKKAGYTLLEVIVSLMVLGLVFSIILPGFYMTRLITEKAVIDRHQAAIQREFNLFFRKQVGQSDCIYCQDGQVYLRDLEARSDPTKERCYNRYGVKDNFLMRYKFEKRYQDGDLDRLVSIGLGSSSQFEQGITAFSLTVIGTDHLLIGYQLVGDENEYELFIKHGKKIIEIPSKQ